MTGSSIFDYVHHQDHGEVAEQLGMGLASSQGAPIASPGSAAGSEEGANSSPGTNHDVSTMMSLNSSTMYKGLERTFCIRMKSTLTKRGCHFKSSGYRVVLLLCRLRPQYQFSHSRKGSPPLLGMVSLAIALPPPSVHEIRLETDMFVIRLTLDFRIAHCEPRIADLLDYTAEELTGMNLYTLCHGEDAHRLRKSHIDLINKGQVMTHYYRLMNKNGGYTWVQTCATIICNSKNSDEQNVICVNYVLSGREYENLIMDCCQLEEHIPAQKVKREETGNNDPENPSPGSQSPEGRGGGGRETGERMGEDRSPEGTGEGSRSILDQQHPIVPTQLHPPDHQMSAMMSRPMKKIERRGQKRKGEEESSCCSSEDEERVARKRYSVLSPASSSCQSSGLAGSPKPPAEDSDATGPTSVKDLEQAMTKHLPTLDKVQQPTDFSTDTLLKAQQQRTTIQWIGAHHHHQQAPLPASTLLRQLYANRESVIRANVRPAAGYYPDVNAGGTLPTPPGDSFDQFGQKAAEFTGLYPGSYEYHSMTPPSSVSPRDKAPPSHYEPSAYTEVLRHQYLADPLPLKPQPYIDPYPAPPMDNSQFYGPNPYLYHNKAPAPTPSYPDPLKNPANWYSTPS